MGGSPTCGTQRRTPRGRDRRADPEDEQELARCPSRGTGCGLGAESTCLHPCEQEALAGRACWPGLEPRTLRPGATGLGRSWSTQDGGVGMETCPVCARHTNIKASESETERKVPRGLHVPKQ